MTDFPALLGISHAQAREEVSDHAPVWIGLTPGLPARSFGPWSPDAGGSRASAGRTGGSVERADGHRDVIGNRSSGIYHLEGCPQFAAVSAANRVPFPSPAAAEAEGYRMARNCQ